MLLHPTLEKLTTMRFTGMAAALDEQMQMDGLDDMAFEERLGLLLDREQAVRETRRMKTRLRKANPTFCLKNKTSFHYSMLCYS